MDAEEIARRVTKCAQSRQRFIVAIAGPPGAGKSTLAAQLLGLLGKRSVRAKIIPMDGFHLDNSILAERGILDRKGAPDTFDANGFIQLIKSLANPESDVAIPVFDRQLDTAIAGDDVVSLDDTILIVEGNYLLCKAPPWDAFQDLWDETIFINPGMNALEKRLVNRWLDYGLNRDIAQKRALSNDIPNARFVLENSAPANIQIT